MGISVDNHQLVMETHTNRSAVLRYENHTLSLDSLKKHLVAVCSVMGVHNVARVKLGNLPLFELDFTGQTTLMTFCKSLNGKSIILDTCTRFVCSRVVWLFPCHEYV